jgi:hypothetical protein
MSSITQKQYCPGKISALTMSKREGEGQSDLQILTNGTQQNEGAPPSATATPSALVKVLRLVFLAVSNVVSFGFTFVGIFAVCGLALNLLGYGYQLSHDDGLVIDTLEHMRMKTQFQKLY